MYRKLKEDSTYEFYNGRWIRRASDGYIVMNPSPETLVAEGWEWYEPQPADPGPQLEPDWTDVIEALKGMASDTVIALPDNEARNVAALFPTWQSMIGKYVELGRRYWYDSSLFKVQIPHTVQGHQNPRIAANLWINVSEELTPEAGTIDNPIQWQNGMVSHAGKYYSENGTTYLCTRNSINPLYYPISQLINHYFHTVE